MKTKFRIKSLWKTLAYFLLVLLHVTDHVRCRPSTSSTDGTRQQQRTRDSSPHPNLSASVAILQASKVKRSVEYRTNDAKPVNLEGHHRSSSRDSDDLELPHHRDHEQFVSFFADEAQTENSDWNSRDDAQIVVDYYVIEGRNLVDVNGEVEYSDVVLANDYSAPNGSSREAGSHASRHLGRSMLDGGVPKIKASSVLSPSDDVNFAGVKTLSRKKRLLSSPVPEADHPTRAGRKHRRRHHRRRHRQKLLLKTKDRKNPSPDDERFPLKSDGPSYLITSANEVKKDWCKTIPLKQKISEPNCRSREIMNNFCYGQCNSFFIPHPGRTSTSSGGDNFNRVAFQSCAFCKPSRYKWVDVVLRCPGQSPPKVEKRVLVVEACRCKTEVLQ